MTNSIELSTQPLKKRLGNRIKAIRVYRGMSQAELAEKANIAPSTLSLIESGKANFKLDSLSAIEKVLQCTLIIIPNEDLI